MKAIKKIGIGICIAVTTLVAIGAVARATGTEGESAFTGDEWPEYATDALVRSCGGGHFCEEVAAVMEERYTPEEVSHWSVAEAEEIGFNIGLEIGG